MPYIQSVNGDATGIQKVGSMSFALGSHTPLATNRQDIYRTNGYYHGVYGERRETDVFEHRPEGDFEPDNTTTIESVSGLYDNKWRV